MIRQTSIEAYNTIKDNGLLSQRRWQVYDVLFRFGPLTGNEVLSFLKQEYSVMAGNAPSIVSRLGELRSMGVVKELGKRICSITGMKVICWDITDRLPVKFEKPKRHKCKNCDGRGYWEETQGRLF